MRVHVESILPCDAQRAWAEVQKRALLDEVAWPIVVLRPAGGGTLPERWFTGMTVRCQIYLFGLIPLGTRTLLFDRVDPVRMQIDTREYDPLVRRWDHRISAQPLAAGKCKYSDTIDIAAGWLTPMVWLFAILFYKHRQRRWRLVARRLQDGAARSSSHS
jgi:hypothetical protein